MSFSKRLTANWLLTTALIFFSSNALSQSSWYFYGEGVMPSLSGSGFGVEVGSQWRSNSGLSAAAGITYLTKLVYELDGQEIEHGEAYGEVVLGYDLTLGEKLFIFPYAGSQISVAEVVDADDEVIIDAGATSFVAGVKTGIRVNDTLDLTAAFENVAGFGDEGRQQLAIGFRTELSSSGSRKPKLSKPKKTKPKPKAESTNQKIAGFTAIRSANYYFIHLGEFNKAKGLADQIRNSGILNLDLAFTTATNDGSTRLFLGPFKSTNDLASFKQQLAQLKGYSKNRQQQQTVYEKPIKPAVRKSNTYYYVQFGIYDSGKQLSDLLRQIDANRNGYPVTLFHSEKLGGYRSLLGPFQTKDQVIAATQYLKDLGLETWTFGRKSLLAK